VNLTVRHGGSVWIETRRNAKGKKRFRVKWREGGRGSKQHYDSTWAFLEHARERKKLLLGMMSRGEDLQAPTERREAPTLREATATWLGRRREVDPKTREIDVQGMDRILPLLGDVPVDRIDVPMLIEAFDRLVAMNRWSGATLGLSKQKLAMVIDEQVSFGYREHGPNPARDKSIKLPKKDKRSKMLPTATDVEKVAEGCNVKYVLPILAIDSGGCRVSEAAGWVQGDLDEKNNRLFVRAEIAKTGVARWVYLAPVLIDAVLETIPPRGERVLDAPLFPGVPSENALSTHMANVCKRVGVNVFRPHTLRARRASILSEEGMPDHKVAEYIGDTPSVTRGSYIFPMTDHSEADYSIALARVAVREEVLV